MNEDAFKEVPEELLKKSESTTNKEADVFKRLLDSSLPATEQPLAFNSDSLSTFNDFKNANEGLRTNAKLCIRGSLHNLLDIASLLELSKVKLRHRYSMWSFQKLWFSHDTAIIPVEELSRITKRLRTNSLYPNQYENNRKNIFSNISLLHFKVTNRRPKNQLSMS